MKIIIFLIPLILLGSCTHTSEKETEVLMKDLSRATKIIAAKNKRNQLKVERLYKSDTTDIEFKNLNKKFISLIQFKEAFLISIEKNSIEETCSAFTQDVLSLLDSESQKNIKVELKDSPIFDITLISQWESERLLITELALEAELITEQVSASLLKNYSTKKQRPGFDWEIYWE